VNGYAPRNTQEYLRFLTHIAECGWLRSYALVVDEERPIAYVLAFQYDDVFYFLETGYLQSWKEASPGAVLTFLMLEDLFLDNRPHVVDFLIGDQSYKRSFSNRTQHAASVYLAPPNHWRLVLRAQAVLHKVSRVMVRSLEALHLDRPLRRLSRQSMR
jgi:CelD/BcsL family acetyltransferase involved in cellulose biosynthesis